MFSTNKQATLPPSHPHNPTHQHTASTIPNSSLLSSTNYRKFQHRRIHTELDEPVSSSNNYQHIAANKYNPYQHQQPNSAGLVPPYKKDYSKPRLAEHYSGIGTSTNSNMYGGQIVSNVGLNQNNSQLSNRMSTNNNNTGTSAGSGNGANTGTGYSNAGSMTRQELTANVSNISKNYKLMPKSTNTALYSKFLKTEPDADDEK